MSICGDANFISYPVSLRLLSVPYLCLSVEKDILEQVDARFDLAANQMIWLAEQSKMLPNDVCFFINSLLVTDYDPIPCCCQG